MAHENLPPAWSVTRAISIVRTFQPNRIYIHSRRFIRRTCVTRRQHGRRRAFGHSAHLNKRDSQSMRARLRRKTHMKGFVGSLRIRPAFWISIARIRTLPTDLKPRHSGAIEKNVDLLAGVDGSDPCGGKTPPQRDLYDVISVERKIRMDNDAAARTERKFLAHAFFLPQSARDSEGLDRRRRGKIPNSQATDLPRSRQIPLEQGRGNRKGRGNVVEAVIRFIRG